MSSILKALKRIEAQSPPPQSFPALPDSVDAKRAVNSNARRRWHLRRLMVVSLALLVIVAAAVVFLQLRPFVTSGQSPAGPPADGQEKSDLAAEKSNIFRARMPSSPVEQNLGKPEPTRADRLPTPEVAAGQKNQRNTTDTGPSEKLTPSKKSIAGRRAAPAKPAQRAAAAPISKKARTYAKLNDSRIKLQALAWSSEAARRMAVINGRIVREGESLDGYQINQIRQEDVVVSDGSQSFSLEFGLKQ